MSKYDFEMNLSQDTSTGIILDQIEKGSVVLEFGCATGRMTRYMKEELDCQVYIVEYDREAYDTALQYAEDGVCDDILNFRWTEKFSEIAFDAIVFADVLEHLSEPEKVLACAATFLKDTGKIYVSLPNITHNDILLKAYEEHFDYTETGLLDDTHVRFWGLENIKQLSEKSGLNIRKVEGTYCPVGGTEQYAQIDRNEHPLLENILKERRCGEVYQFVLTFDKSDTADTVYEFRKPTIRSHVYCDTGSGFNPEEIIAFDSVYSGHGSYMARCKVENIGRVRRLRLDPVEFQSCILQHVSVRQGEKVLPLSWANGIEIKNGVLLTGNDPLVYIDVLSSDDPVSIEAEIVLPGAEYLRLIETELEYVTKAATEERVTFRTMIEELNREKGNLVAKKADLQREIAELRMQVAKMNDENESLQRDMCAYIILANNKEKYILELENERGERIKHEQMLKQQIHYYQNIKIVKLRTFILRVLRGIKRRIKRLL